MDLWTMWKKLSDRNTFTEISTRGSALVNSASDYCQTLPTVYDPMLDFSDCFNQSSVTEHVE